MVKRVSPNCVLKMMKKGPSRQEFLAVLYLIMKPQLLALARVVGYVRRFAIQVVMPIIHGYYTYSPL